MPTVSSLQRTAGWPYRKIGPAFACILLLAAGLVVVQWHQHHLVAMSVQSNSMQPLFSKGDALVVAAVEPTLIHTGDIVSYPDPLHPQVIVSHRVVEVDHYTGKLVTKGDANAVPDPATSTLAVLGVARYMVPKAGFFIDALRSWLGLAGLVYLPSALVAAAELRRLVRSYIVPTYMLHR